MTAKVDIVDRVVGFELGGDDYVTKPFDMRELIARVKSLLRRMAEKNVETEDIITIRNIKVSKLKREVAIEGKVIDLTLKEYELLLIFISNPGRVFSREVILDKIWGMEYVGGTRTVDIHVQRLRKKIGEENEDIIQTVHSVGYKGKGN